MAEPNGRAFFLEQFDRIIKNYGGFHNVPVNALRNCHEWILQMPNITQEQIVEANAIAEGMYTARRNIAAAQLSRLNQLLNAPEGQFIGPQNPEAFLKEVEQEVIPKSQRIGRAEKPFLTFSPAHKMLCQVIDKHTASAVFFALSDPSIKSSHLETFCASFQGYVLLNLLRAGADLGVKKQEEVLKIVSCYQGREIRDAVKEIRPEKRYDASLYLQQENISLEMLMEPLRRIQTSLQEGNISYMQVVFLLDRKMIPGDAPFFNSLIESQLDMNPDGTYSPGSFTELQERTEGYRYLPSRVLVGEDKRKLTDFFHALKEYRGNLAITIDLTQAPSFTRGQKENVFLFKCNERSNVDIKALGEAVGMQLGRF